MKGYRMFLWATCKVNSLIIVEGFVTAQRESKGETHPDMTCPI